MNEKDERGNDFGSGFITAILIGIMIYFGILTLDNIGSGHWGRVIAGVFAEAILALLVYGVFKGLYH
jgi:hypothetical protein